MDTILHLVGQYGLLLVTACVLLEQIGLPVPAYAMLVLSGSLAAGGQLSVHSLVLAAVVACLSADFSWYAIGRRKGDMVLAALARGPLLSPARVHRIASVSRRWGLPTLLVARFIPGLSGLLTVVAGQARIPPVLFLIFAAAGAVAWAGSALAIGWAYAAQAKGILASLQQVQSSLLLVAALSAAAIVVLRRGCR